MKLSTSQLAFDCNTGADRNGQSCIPNEHLQNLNCSHVIFSGSVPAPVVRIPFPQNGNMVNAIPMNQRIGKMNIFSLGFTKEEVCDLELSVLEEKMRRSQLNQSQVHVIKNERERLKRQKRKKRHKQKLKDEFNDLEMDVDHLTQMKSSLEKEKIDLVAEINSIVTYLSSANSYELANNDLQ
ncbi:hypothetical protein LOD99_12976 [Oopsacas minuta]|uniref:BZIP domain-containing protein n=1 Tax=Oopsacas minuta TaxID=111878 RepID=A0AAV7J9M2_9METZ|nr:hypothetical protein LOD99_12976 [Oopsacas minuta]